MIIKDLFKIHYRIRPGSCKWKHISIKGTKYYIAIPITKWIFKLEPIKMWVYFGKTPF